MPGYSKLVPEIVDSSIWNESSDTRVVWITMIAVKDENGFVHGDVKSLSRRANVSVEACAAALTCFLNPDPESSTSANEGRRITPGIRGWTVLNHEKYREIGMSEANKEYWREKKRLERSKSLSGNVQDNSGQVQDSSVSVSASVLRKGSTEGKPNKARPANEQEVIDFCTSLGLPASDGVYMWANWQANGFMRGKTPIKDWKAAIRTWQLQNYLPSQKPTNGNGFQRPPADEPHEDDPRTQAFYNEKGRT
jgi:hypothetical protein